MVKNIIIKKKKRKTKKGPVRFEISQQNKHCKRNFFRKQDKEEELREMLVNIF